MKAIEAGTRLIINTGTLLRHFLRLTLAVTCVLTDAQSVMGPSQTVCNGSASFRLFTTVGDVVRKLF